MANAAGPKIIRDSSLILNLDAANPKSYTGTGTTWTDLTKNKLNASITGCTYSSANGGSLVYNGTTSTYITIPDSTTIRTQNFTIAAWVKFAGFNAYNAVICKPQNIGWTNPYASILMRTDSNTTFTTSIGSNTTYSNTTTAYSFATNIFYNFVMTYDGATIKGYINSSLITNASVAYTINYTSVPLVIGADGGGNPYGENLNGNMYNILMYNRALSATEVYNNYVADKGRFGY